MESETIYIVYTSVTLVTVGLVSSLLKWIVFVSRKIFCLWELTTSTYSQWGFYQARMSRPADLQPSLRQGFKVQHLQDLLKEFPGAYQCLLRFLHWVDRWILFCPKYLDSAGVQPRPLLEKLLKPKWRRKRYLPRQMTFWWSRRTQ